MKILPLLLFCLCLLPFAAAATEAIDARATLEERLAVVEPGVLPDSFWYWADIYAEELRYVFTWSKEQRADYLLLMAEERLAEMKKLSEEGIKGYADKLMGKHEALVYKAQALYAEVKERAAEKAGELQTESEDEIYRQEMNLKNEIRSAPDNLATARDSVAATIMDWLKTVKDHLRWKKGQVEEQRANYPGY